MFACDDKVVHEDFNFFGKESSRCLLELKEQEIYNSILASFLFRRVNAVNLKMETVSFESFF